MAEFCMSNPTLFTGALQTCLRLILIDRLAPFR